MSGTPSRTHFARPPFGRRADAPLPLGPQAGAMADRPAVVHPPSPSGGRRVTVDGEILGLAYGPADVEEFLRRAGAEDPETAMLTDVEWRGGGPGVWEAGDAPSAE